MSEVEQLQGILKLLSGGILFFLLIVLLRGISNLLDKKERVKKEQHWYYTIPLKVIEVIDQALGVKTLRLSREDGESFPQFKPGQFITAQIPSENGVILRSYSISSSTLNTKIIDISVKKIPDGIGSGHLHQLRVGDQIQAFAPSGHFTLEQSEERELVFIAGGIGITPITSIIRTAIELGRSAPMTLFYSARTKEDLAFDGLFEYLAKESSNFNYFPILSRGSRPGGDRGHLSVEYIREKIQELQNKVYYICGPGPMADSIEKELLQGGISREAIKREVFVMPSQLRLNDLEEREVEVVVNGNRLHYKGKETLLDFLLTNDIKTYYSCKTGVCGTCKCKLSSGEVEMLSKSGLTPEEEKRGEILPCVSFPQTDIELVLGDE